MTARPCRVRGLPDRIVVVGIGNRFVHDDAVGLQVAEELKRKKEEAGEAFDGVSIQEYEEMDLSLLQEFKDASLLIIVDSVKSGTKPGTVSTLEVAEDSAEISGLPSLHELELADMVSLARKMGIVECPVLIVGIEPADLGLGEGLSKEVESAVPVAVRVIMAQLSGAGRD